MDILFRTQTSRERKQNRSVKVRFLYPLTGLKNWVLERNYMLSLPKNPQEGSQVYRLPYLISVFFLPFCELSRLVSDFLHTFIRKFAKGILLRQLSVYPWRPSVMFPIYRSSCTKMLGWAASLWFKTFLLQSHPPQQYKMYHILKFLYLSLLLLYLFRWNKSLRVNISKYINNDGRFDF